MTTGNSPREIRRGGSVLAVSILASVAFPKKLDAVRVARGTGRAVVLSRKHDRLWTIDPATLPTDGSTVAAGTPVSVH